VQGKPSVEGPTAAQAADAGRDSSSSAAADGQNLEGMVADLNEFAQTVVQRQLQFSVDEESGKTVIKVIDTETEEVIRQIPPEVILEIQKRLGETNGLLFQSSA
jgi:flagellar protein FlaG